MIKCKKILLLCLIILFVSMAGVSASDSNQTDDALGVSDSDLNQTSDIISVSNDEDVLGNGPGTFADFKSIIDGNESGAVIVLDKNYLFDDVTFGLNQTGIVIDKPLTIDGAGFYIDGNNFTRLFNIISSDVTIKDIKLTNAYFSDHSVSNQYDPKYPCFGGAILVGQNVANIKFENVTFEDNNVHADNNWRSGKRYKGYGGAIYFSSNVENVTFDSCNFTNNNAYGGYADGGAVYFNNVNNVLFKDSYFYNNTILHDTSNTGTTYATGTGAAVYLGPNSNNITFKNGIIFNNSVVNVNRYQPSGKCYYTDDAIRVGSNSNVTIENFDLSHSGIQNSGNLTVKNVNFTNKSSITNVGNLSIDTALFKDGIDQEGRGGGAIYMNGGTAIIRNAEFINNEALSAGYYYYYNTYSGGAIYVNSGEMKIYNSSFKDNFATYNGGAIYSKGNLSVYDSSFDGNWLSYGGWEPTGYGGAVYLAGNTNIISGCNFTNNYIDYGSGGAIYASANSVNNTIDNCNFTNNTASYFECEPDVQYHRDFPTGYGGAIGLNSANNTITNSYFVNNTAHWGSAVSIGGSYYNPGSNLSVSHSTFKDNKLDNLIIELEVSNAQMIAYVDLFAGNTQIEGIYSSSDTVEYDNVTYVDASGTHNSDVDIPVYNKYVSSQEVILEVWDGDELVRNSTKLSNDEGHAVFDDLNLENDNYDLKAYHLENEYYVYGETKGQFIKLGDFDALQELVDWTPENGVLELNRNYTYDLELDTITDGIYINKNITIIGNGFTINALNQSRVFILSPDGYWQEEEPYDYVILPKNITLKGLTLVNATAFKSNEPIGGAIIVDENVTLTVDGCNLINNTASVGSAIFHISSETLNITESTFRDNKLTNILVDLNYDFASNSVLVSLNSENTQIDAIYSVNDVVEFSNVNYLTDKGMLNTDTYPSTYSSAVAFQNVTVEIYDNDDILVRNITNLTNELGIAVFGDLELDYGDYMILAYHADNTQYAYGDKEIPLSLEKMGDFDYLQLLIDSTPENGVLELNRNFTYDLELDTITAGIVIDKNITILGNGFTINALNQSRIFLIYDEGDYPHYQVTLENITFINANGYVDNNLMRRYGGAILTINDLIVENCVFSNNSAEACGAICSMQANILTINDSNFTNCTAFSAGAVGVMQCNNFTINNSFFTENSAMYGGAVLMQMINNTLINNTYFIRNNATVIGSAIASWQSNLTISESGFLNNSVVLDDNYGDENPCGGTVAIAYSSSSELNIITDCDFLNNTVYGTNQPLIGGSAVLMYGDFNSPPEATLFVNNSNFDNNGVFLNGSNMVVMGSFFMYSIKDLTVNNSNFTNNNISVNGSSMFVGGSSISILGVNAFNVNNSNFSNNTAFSNESEYSGGAIFAYYVEGDMNISNSNFDNNNAFSNESELNGGGAIFALEIIGDITIGHSNFDNNNAFSNESELNGGGAIFAYYVGGDMNISDSGFDNNNAFSNESEYSGGAIFAYYVEGDMNISNSNFTNNSACNGSAIYILQSNNVNLINSSFLENLANASIVLDINETDYSAVATVIANDNYINAVYCDESTLNFDNVTYWDGEKIVNSNDVSPVLSTVLPNRLVVFDVYDEEKKLYKTFSLLTNDSSQVEFEYLDWIDGDFNVSSHITADAYYRSSSFENEISIRIGDFNRLQLYVDKTPDGGVLNLTRDYKYTIGLDTIDEGIEIKKNITINGNGYTIDAQNKSRIFFIANDEHQSTSGVLLANVTINNITFINGNRYEENHQERGGAIYASVGNSLIIDNCTFKDNLAVQGGAVFLVLCMGTIQNSLFTDNCATDAAGALLTMFSYADIENCTFINNSAGQAGAVECVIGGLTIVESDFINNTASLVCGAFGAMMFGTIEIQSSNFINNTIKNNSSDNIGCGAVEFGMGDNVIINDCNFTNNIVNASGNSNAGIIYGGAIITTVVLNTMINQSTFDNNGIIYEGNALAIGGAISDFYQDIGTGDYNITISNSNFTNNYAGIGGAIYLDHKNNITIYNVHLANNTADEGAGIFINRSSNVTVEDSSFVNNTAGNGAAVYVSGSTDVTVNGSSFADNSANAYAGGIFAKDSTLNITNSNFTGNEGVNGSALYVSGSKVGVNNTEFGENSNDNSIYLGSGNLNIENSRLYDSNSIYNGGETSLTNVIELSSGGDYVILNKGNLLLNNNKFNNLIINDINVATKTNVVILENRTIATTERSYMLIANVTDDAGNTIKLNEFKFKDGDTVLGDATFDGKLYSFYYEDISIGAHLISALFDGLEDADMKIGIIKVLNPSFLELDISQISNNDVVINATISPGDISGNISFMVNNIVYEREIKDGVASLTLKNLIPGTYNVLATYPGNEFYMNSSDNSSFVVKFLPSTIMLDVDVENAVIKASVTEGATGNVTFIVDDVAYTKQVGEDLDYEMFAPGNHSIVAIYNGDAFYSSSYNLTVVEGNKYESFIYVSADNIVYGNDTIICVEIGEGQTGSVTISVGGKNYTKVIDDIIIKFSVSGLDAGNYTVYASYSGDEYYNETADSGSFNVTKSDLDADVRALDVTTLENASFILSVPDDFAGKVKITVDDETYDGDVNTLVQMASLTEGSKSATVEFYGDNNYKDLTLTAKFNVTEELKPVVKNESGVEVEVIDNKVVAGVASGVEGNVTFIVNGKEYSREIVDGKAVLDDAPFVVGNNSIVAYYPGNDDFNSSIDSIEYELAKLASLVKVSAKDISYGSDAVIDVEVPVAQTGTVTINVGGKSYTEEIKNGKSSFSIPDLSVDTYPISVTYDGDANYDVITNSSSFKVIPARLDACVSALDVTTLENASFILSVPDDFAGKVKITVDGKTYDGDVNTLVQMASLTEGSKSATVEFYGDNNYKNLTLTAEFMVSEELKPVVKNESGVEVEVIDNKVVAGVASGVEGNVTFIVNGKEYSREIVDGKAVLDDVPFVVGNNSIVAYYPGNDDFNSSIDSIEYELAKLASLVKVSAKDISYGSDAIIDVEVPVAQTGTVTITVGGKSYTEEIKNGKSSFSIPDLSVDTYPISVTYDGDANYDVITNSSSFKVIPARLDASVSALDVTTLENASFIVSVPDDFAGKVKISVDGKTYDGDVNTLIQMASLTEGNKSATVEFYGDNNYKNLTLTAEFKVTEETTPVVKKDANVTIDFNNDKITVTLPDDATGNVTIFVNDEKYVVPVKDGKAVLSDVQLTDGENVITAIYSGDEDYNLAYGDKNVLIKNNKTITISAENVTKYFSGPEKFEVSITYGDGTPVPGIEVLIKINGVEYDRATNTKGIASFSLNLNSGNYTVDVKVDEFNFVSTNHVEILPTIYAADVTKVYRNGTQYYALFLDGEGNPLVNTEVSFNINGIFYKRTTNASGWAKLNLNLEKGKYILTAINPSTSEMRSNIVTVISQLETCDLTKYYKNDSQFVVRVRADDGSWAGAGEVVSFNVHGRLYNRTTNATGHAVLNINLEPEEYTITSYYKECREGNSIEVLPVLTADDLSMKYKDGSQFKAKLVDGQGKPYAGQNITFNINGVFYNRTTDSGGVAKLNIRLQSGKYIITSEYEGSRISNTIKIGA